MLRPSPSPVLSRAAAALVASLLLAACSESTGPGTVETITELPRQLSAVEERVRDGSNDFAFELAGELLPEGPGDNLFWSPLSASMLLGMVLNGADGDSFDQMRDVLGFDGMSQAEINAGYRDLIDLLVGLDPTVTMEIGNSTWTDTGFPVLPDFSQRVSEHFDAEATALDLSAPASVDAINGWVDDATRGRIEKIVDGVPANVVMILLNAIYFQGDWTVQFEKDRTEVLPFTRPDDSTVDADLMFLSEPFDFGFYEDVSIVDLPYGGEAFSMTVVVPREGVGVNEVVAGLDRATWDGWIDGLSEGEYVVRLPRFELEWDAELNDPLMALGMTDAFDAARADFGRLTPGGGIWLGLVKQKAFVKVDEEGTEAAAATIGFMPTSAPPEVVADRPFLFVLRERLTGTILFMGVVNDPTAG